MEEKTNETQNIKEEIKLLTFQPEQMLEEIEKLKGETQALTIDNHILQMINIDLREDLKNLQRRIPKSFKELFRDMILRLLGGQWEENKE